ncbi:MAG: DnaJ C-terminal domain-containing protein [Alphaproteobacteria bacterium]
MAETEKNLYEVLGVARDASADAIRKAHRALAKKYHPDLNPGDAKAEEKFKEIQTANDILSDEEKRRQYDAGEIDAQGNETQRHYYREYASGGDSANRAYHSSAGFEDLGDIFSDLFRARDGGTGGNIRFRGRDVRYTMDVTFLEAVNGAKKRVTMPDGKSLDITIPPGQRDEQILRLRGKGGEGMNGGEAGDAYVEVHVGSHPVFERRDDDIRLELPVALHEAVLGGKIRVPTVSGAVSMTIPPGSNSGDTLRLRGKGVPAHGGRAAGDQIVTLKVVLPEAPDDALNSFVETWAKDHAYDPRSGMEADK